MIDATALAQIIILLFRAGTSLQHFRVSELSWVENIEPGFLHLNLRPKAANGACRQFEVNNSFAMDQAY